MAEDEETSRDGDADAGETERRDTDIEDQGQAIDAVGEVDPDVESVDGDETDPGPEGAGAREATQKSGEAPTEVVDDEDTDPDDE